MKFTAIILSSLVACGLAAPAYQAPAADPDPTQVWVESVTYGGTGCPQGSAAVSMPPDRKSFTILLDAYYANAGPGFTIVDSRKNCQLNVQLHYPSGFQYSVFSSDYRGFIDLPEKVVGYQKATYYFAGESIQASTETKFTGPRSGDYFIHDEIPFTSTIWSPCGRYANLNINSQVRIDSSGNPTKSALLTADAIDGKVAFQVGVQWDACPVRV